MATCKAVSSKQSLNGAIKYVSREGKTEENLMSGYNVSSNPTQAIDQMNITKQIWDKTDGRTYKHYVQSFHKDEQISPETAHEIARQLVEKYPNFQGHEVFIATHIDKDNIHSHIIVNSVNAENGYKYQASDHDLDHLKAVSDEICRSYGLSITEKGKTFEGLEREETSTYTTESYQILKQAEKGDTQSYVQDIALCIMDCRETARSREEFIQSMNERGVGVTWEENRKYITYTDLNRQEQGETKCKIRDNKLEKYYNIGFGKEVLSREFEGNARKYKSREEQPERGIEPGKIRVSQREKEVLTSARTARADDREIRTEQSEFVRNERIKIADRRATERKSEEIRDDKISQREDRNAERERLNHQREQRVAERSRSHGTRSAEYER